MLSVPIADLDVTPWIQVRHFVSSVAVFGDSGEEVCGVMHTGFDSGHLEAPLPGPVGAQAVP